MDPTKLKQFIENEFTSTALPALKSFITIPNQSPAYDPNWQKSKTLKDAASNMKQFAEKSIGIEGLTAILSGDEDKTPFLLITVESTASDGKSILFYGHYDKQPPGEGWSEGLGAYTPVEQDGYLYGRGSADDGYALFSVLTMIKAIQNFKIPHPKFVIIIEGSEESGSTDLPTYLEEYAQFIGKPNIIISLDSEAGDYDRIWLSSSLRGGVNFDLTVNTLTKGVHSGQVSGIAPESFMIMRKLISRLENYEDKLVGLKDFEVEIPDTVKTAAEKTFTILGDKWLTKFPILPGVNFIGENNVELYLNNTWKPSLTVLGAKGIPSLKDAGNVLRPYTSIRISIRTPPTFDSVANGKKIIIDKISQDPPFKCNIQMDNWEVFNGVQLNDPSDNLRSQLNLVAKNYLKEDTAQISLGLSIPFAKIFSQYFPDSQFIVTGAAGLDSNTHGPNERLNLGYTKNFICTFAHLIAGYKKFL